MSDERGKSYEGERAAGAGGPPQAGEKRVALVIGNARYDHGKPLTNPHNDAAAIAAMLARLGFELHSAGSKAWYTDLGLRDMRRVLASFSRQADAADMTVVYFAGHGMEFAGVNYLLPRDCEPNSDDRIMQADSITLDDVLGFVKRTRKFRMVILDACRVNEFERRDFGPVASRGGLTGLNESALDNMLVVYAARHGEPALDGNAGENSPFATALLEHLETSDTDVELLIRRVVDRVRKTTNGRQVPHKYGHLGGEPIYLKRSPPSETVAPPPPSGSSSSTQPDADDRLWKRLEGSEKVADFRFYLEQFPAGRHAPLALFEIRRLEALETEARQQSEAEARVRAEADARAKAEVKDREARERAAASTKIEADARQRVEEDTHAKAEEEAQQRAEAEARAKVEKEAQQRAEAEARAKAAKEAQQRAEAEARAKAAKEAQQRAEAEARAKAEKEAQQRAEAEIERREQANWTWAELENTVESYELFLSVWPNSRFSTEARLRSHRLMTFRQGKFRVHVAKSQSPQDCWLAPGTTFRDKPFAPELVLIKPGEFWMGAQYPDRPDEERPRHLVKIDYPLLVGKHPVTNHEWQVFLDGESRKIGHQSNHPAVNVSWHDAKAYVVWLSEKTNMRYRLLSEAEWEYACRAGTTSRYSFGNEAKPTLARFSTGERGSGNGSVAVGSFNSNGFGLQDMHGNVWEWCEDAWHPNYVGAPENGSPREGTQFVSARVLRGGSWYSTAELLQSSARSWNEANNKNKTVGFRVARECLNPT